MSENLSSNPRGVCTLVTGVIVVLYAWPHLLVPCPLTAPKVCAADREPPRLPEPGGEHKYHRGGPSGAALMGSNANASSIGAVTAFGGPAGPFVIVPSSVLADGEVAFSLWR